MLTVANPNMEVELFPKFQLMFGVLSEELLAKQQIDFEEFKTSSPEQQYLNNTKKTRSYSTRATTSISELFEHDTEIFSHIRKRLLQNSKS